MKLTAKLLLVFSLAILLVTSVYGYLAVRREEQIFAERAHTQARQLAATMDEIGRQMGTQQLMSMLTAMPELRRAHRARYVWFDAPPNTKYSPEVPATALGSLKVRETVAVAAKRPDGKAFLYVYWPVQLSPHPEGLEFSYSMEGLETAKKQAIVATAWLLGSLVATAGMMVFLAGVALVATPLDSLTEKTRQVAAGDLSQPVELTTGDELGELAASLNEMCARLEDSQRRVDEETTARVAALEQLRHSDRLRTVGRLASGIAHELGTPLNVISGRADLIAAGKLDNQQQLESARIVKQEAERMTTIIRQLLAFARRGESKRTPVALHQVVEQTLTLLAPLAAKRQIDLQFRPECQSCCAEIDMGQIQQVLTNVVMNAVQASDPGSVVEIELSQQHLDGDESHRGEFAVLSVIDRGEGITADDLEQIFEPFYTTKSTGDGTGLGLSIAQRIVEEHDGSIEVESHVGEGSTFRICLPCVAVASG